MRIAVPICSRNRPLGLIAVVTALNAIASKRHEIAFAVRCDDDDAETGEAAAMLKRAMGDAVVVVKRPRPDTLGGAVNEATAALGRWDACCAFTDDLYPLANHWDVAVSNLIQERGLAACAWHQLGVDDNVTLPIVSRRWYDAVGYLQPDWFPFWFGDTWIMEVYLLAFENGMSLVRDLPLGGGVSKTTGMRDLDFWFRFFAATRPIRVAEADRVAKSFGAKPGKMRPAILAEMERRDAVQFERVPHYEKTFGTSPGAPSPRYEAARRRAEDWLAGRRKG